MYMYVSQTREVRPACLVKERREKKRRDRRERRKGEEREKKRRGEGEGG